MSVAYVVLAHRAPSQVARLVDRITGPQDRVIVHLDRRVDAAPFSRALSEPVADGRVQFARRRFRSRWASYALVGATLAAVEQALETSPASHVCLLSGDSYPLVSAAALGRFFAASEDRSYMFLADGSQTERPDRSTNAEWFWNGDLRRVTYRHYQLGERQLHLPNRFVPWFPRLSPPEDMTLLHGSQWWALSRPAARLVVETFLRRSDVRRYFRRVQAPDEWAFQMVVGNSALASSVINDDLHFIDWEGWHARTLTLDDLPRLAASSKLFARKLDPDDVTLADAIDQLVTHRGTSTASP